MHIFQRGGNEFIAPCSFHDVNHFRLMFNRDVALQRDKNRPVIFLDGIPYRDADTLERDTFAEGVPMSDDQAFRTVPCIYFDAAGATRQNVGIRGSRRSADELTSQEIGVM
jgi:hypothetical protein